MKQRSTTRKKTPTVRKKAVASKASVPETEIILPKSLTVKHLADLLEISPIETIKRLMRRGVMANVNQAVDYDIAAAVAIEMGREPQLEQEDGVSVEVKEGPVSKKEAKALKPRPCCYCSGSC